MLEIVSPTSTNLINAGLLGGSALTLAFSIYSTRTRDAAPYQYGQGRAQAHQRNIGHLASAIEQQVGEACFPQVEPFIPGLQVARDTFMTEIANGSGVAASGDKRFGGKNVIYGRDSTEWAEGVHTRELPAVCRNYYRSYVEDEVLADPNEFYFLRYHDSVQHVLKLLASFRALEDKPDADGMQGAIPHEVRLEEDATPEELAILQELGPLRGGDETQMIYYGSSDVTSSWTSRTIDEIERDPSFLDLRYTNFFTKEFETIADALDGAEDLFRRQLTAPGNSAGMLRTLRTNPNGLRLHTTRDSQTGAVHEDGTPLNPDREAISLEANALRYEALQKLAKLRAVQGQHDRAAELLSLAATLKSQVMASFWMEDKQYFASYLNANEDGVFEQLTTVDSTAGEILRTGILDPNDPEDQKKIRGIVDTLLDQSKFLWNGGLRMRALEHADLIPYWDYHGTMTAWRHVTIRFALGLFKLGMLDLASELFVRVAAVTVATGRFLELDYVDKSGRLGLPECFRKMPGKNGETIIPRWNFLAPWVRRPTIEKNADDPQTWALRGYETAVEMLCKIWSTDPAERKKLPQAAPGIAEYEQEVLARLKASDELFANRPVELIRKIGKTAFAYQPKFPKRNKLFEVLPG